jgi:hypothetical protein
MADAPENTRFQAYVDGLIAGEFEDKTKKEIAAQFDINPKTLWDWDHKIDWEMVKSERRKLYAAEILKIDGAMLRASKKGDVAAAKVVYERFDGWVPMQGVKNFDAKSDSELIEEAKKIKAQLSEPIRPDQPGTGAAATA